MPTPRDGESRDDFINRCIPIVLDDGTAEDAGQAFAVCRSMWEQDKKELNMESETVVIFGDKVKALGNGRVGGYLVRFTTDNDPDLEGEFFTADTDFGEAESAPVYYQHGMDQVLGKRRIGKAVHKKDDFGVWAEAQLDLRDEYERFVYAMAEQGKMGWSSGTAGHLIERVGQGKATWIKSWPLGLDDTLTPTPAEPRNEAVPLKSWKPTAITTTLAERISWLNDELKNITNDLSGLTEKIDKPLSETKRKELSELLGMFSGLDAVRSDIDNILKTAPQPVGLVEARLASHKLAELRKKYGQDTQE
jgi:hypothetical protein